MKNRLIHSVGEKHTGITLQGSGCGSRSGGGDAGERLRGWVKDTRVCVWERQYTKEEER